VAVTSTSSGLGDGSLTISEMGVHFYIHLLFTELVATRKWIGKYVRRWRGGSKERGTEYGAGGL